MHLSLEGMRFWLLHWWSHWGVEWKDCHGTGQQCFMLLSCGLAYSFVTNVVGVARLQLGAIAMLGRHMRSSPSNVRDVDIWIWRGFI